jgi:hypothetical protein
MMLGLKTAKTPGTTMAGGGLAKRRKVVEAPPSEIMRDFSMRGAV